MAFAESVGGERYNLRTGNTVPKKLSAAYLAATPAPTKWHLVKLNSNNDEVDRCAAGDVPYGYLFSLTGGIGMCTVLVFRDNVIMAEYTGAITVGTSKLVADGSDGTIRIGGFLRDRVKAGSGTAMTINKDVYATGVLTMENS